MPPPEETAEEAGIYGRLLEETADGPIESLLELGSGRGHNALYLKQRFQEVVHDQHTEGLFPRAA
jgi:hypothetical protein